VADPEDDLLSFLDAFHDRRRPPPIAWRFVSPPLRADENFTRCDERPTFDYMEAGVPKHVRGLVAYLGQPDEKANEDRATAYFREVFGETFRRQTDAGLADGYVPGLFLLELKGKKGDWFKGLVQGLAYSRELDFASVVVAAEGFLAVWRVEDIPADIRAGVAASAGAPSKVGPELAAKFKSRKVEVQKLAMWTLGPEFLDGGLFGSKPELVTERFKNFERTLREGRRVREKITPRNFTKILKQMVEFFDPKHPIKAVRAFYSIIFGWDEGSKVLLSTKHPDQATVGGETITDLVPERRDDFKEFVERHAVTLGKEEHTDDFFAHYDKALDTVEPSFRRQHGIFFTDLDLSRFVMWLVRRSLGDIGKNYLVIDPACGSGNLVTNWRSPLELRHKVVSEIEPELLFAVEKRMKGDSWHEGRFTVVPRVTEGRGLNFLEHDAATYLGTLQEYLLEKGHDANRPIAFLCNPPYRNDKDRKTADAVDYDVHPTIAEVITPEATQSRDCCFLAQMKLVCEAAKESNLPGDSLLLVFTKINWLTDRGVLGAVRKALLADLEAIGGILVNGKEFFDISGKFPIAFTMWRFRPGAASASSNVVLTDLTHLTKKQLAAVNWTDQAALERACESILMNAKPVSLGFGRTSMYEWVGSTMQFFLRERRKSEPIGPHAGGLPRGDPRLSNKKAYGEVDGEFVGFMDDRTPCRVKRGPVNVPWFRLDRPIMDCRKGRCFSGPPDQKAYVAETVDQAKKLFLWYAIQKDFSQYHYPMWADAMELWAPNIPPRLAANIYRLAFALGFADNECVETRFHAHNPIPGVRELFVRNPMAPTDPESFWVKHMKASFAAKGEDAAHRLVAAVEALYTHWTIMFRKTPEIAVKIDKAYFIGPGFVRASSGISQIKDYANLKLDTVLLNLLGKVQAALKEVSAEFHDLLVGATGLDYFRTAAPGIVKAPAQAVTEVRQPPLDSPVLKAAERTRSWGSPKSG